MGAFRFLSRERGSRRTARLLRVAFARTGGGIALIDAAGLRQATLTSNRGAVDWALAWSRD
jgi:hypothetical protein